MNNSEETVWVIATATDKVTKTIKLVANDGRGTVQKMAWAPTRL
jgi:hypothetical protein